MLLVFTTFLLLLAVASLAFFVKRLVQPVLLDQEDERRSLAAETYRPLFAPTDEDLWLAEREEKKLLKANREEIERQEAKERLAQFEEFRASWQERPTRATTIELLYRSSQIADGNVYLDTCERVLDAWQEGKLADVSAADLHQLFETHFWLLPANERTPGASFRLKEAAAKLKGQYRPR